MKTKQGAFSKRCLKTDQRLIQIRGNAVGLLTINANGEISANTK